MTFDYRDIFGYDVSTHQDSPLIPGTVDFQKMKATGAKFVIFRASIGNTPDADYQTYVNNCHGVLPWSAYHYFIHTMDPRLQAERLWNTIKAEPPQMIWLDCEEGTTETWKAWYDFIEEFKRLSGWGDNRIGIYTGFYVFTQITTYASNPQKSYFGRFPLWLAWYFSDPPRPDYDAVRIPYPWDKITILQSGTPAIGLQAGVESQDIDYNHLNGGEDVFVKLFGGEISQPEPEEPMTRYEATAIGDGTRLRPAHNTNNTYLGNYPRGTKFHGDELWTATSDIYVMIGTVNTLLNKMGDQWLRVTDVNGVATGREAWVAVTHRGAVITTLNDNGPAPVDGLPDVLYIGLTADTVKLYRKEL